jgi:hypothetical protein
VRLYASTSLYLYIFLPLSTSVYLPYVYVYLPILPLVLSSTCKYREISLVLAHFVYRLSWSSIKTKMSNIKHHAEFRTINSR